MLEIMNPDRRLDEFAARQYGVFSLRQARSVGLTRSMVETRVRTDAWIRLAPSIYALASAPPKWERQMAAAILSRTGSIVAGRSAAYLHDFEGFGPGRPVILTGLEGNARSPLANVIRSSRFEEVSRVRKHGFVLTDESETVATLARHLTHARLEALVDRILARGSSTVDGLSRVVQLSKGMPGIVRLRPIVDDRRGDAFQPPTSELERLLYALLGRSPVPTYTRQLPFSFETLELTVDAYIAAWSLIVEGDGRRWHTRKADFERDRLRDNEATARGFAVLRFTYQMLRDRPGECLRTLLRTGEVRTAS